MSMQDFRLLRLLTEKVGITTAQQLDEFKKHTGAKTNTALIKRLCLYIASDTKWDK